MKEYIKNLIYEKPFTGDKLIPEIHKTRRKNGLTIITGSHEANINKISAEEWNDIVYYIEDLEERIEALERRVGRE